MKEEKEVKVQERLTENELMVRLKVFIGGCLAITLIGIVFTVLYSVMFVTQPLNAISPVDQKFFELIIPIATFLTGTLSGIMLAGTGENAALAGAKSNTPKPIPAPVPPKPVSSPPPHAKKDDILEEEIG